jgi:putative endonuclease
MIYTVYILECSDKTFYTGYTKNLEKRLWDHNNSNRGARYTHTRRPVHVIYTEEFDNQRDAMRREREIKMMTRNQKELVVDSLWRDITQGMDLKTRL